MVTMAKIGRSLEAQGKNKSASEQYLAAMDYARTLEQSEGVKKAIANLHTDLADVLRD